MWLWCPGSPFATYKTCSSIPAGHDTQCNATKGCAVQQKSSGGSTSSFCTAAFMVKVSQQQQDAWFDRFRALDASVVGSCESVCYLRGIFSCAGIDNLSDNTTAPGSSSSRSSRSSNTGAPGTSSKYLPRSPREAACRGNPSCHWSSESRYCSANLVGSDAWGQAAASAAAQCSALSKDRGTCEGGSSRGTAAVLAARVQQYKNYQQPADSVSGMCA
jgi:hypothetical protein